MERLFFAFPRGWPAVALLLMRSTIGLALLVQGGFYVRESDPAPAAWAVGLAAILAAGLLLIGFLTPFASSAVAIGRARNPAIPPAGLYADSVRLESGGGFRRYNSAGDRRSRPRSNFCRRAHVRAARNHFPACTDSRVRIRSAAARELASASTAAIHAIVLKPAMNASSTA